MGTQPQLSSYLRQLADPGRAQLQDLLRVPHPAGLLHADLQLGPGRRVRGPAGPRLLRRPLRPALCPPQPGEGVGAGYGRQYVECCPCWLEVMLLPGR